MRLPKIIYLQLAMIYVLSPVEIHSERIKIVTKGGKTRQVQISEEQQSQRLRKDPVTEKAPISEDDDDRKTLAQQVLDGKYGLIQTELFSSPVKRPGILSYEINPEVPKDNINNLGGLKPDEIWLAENHLLVLKGGSFSENEQTDKVIWQPIDSYVAPQRQVKIPPNPKIPPPFPIQLKDGGPIEVLKGKNGTKAVPSYFGPPFLYQNPLTTTKEANENETKQRQGNLTQGNGGIPFPFLPPGIGLFPPAIAFLPPPGNLTELDEDDPNIYYPPRYDFVYMKNYTSYVPPGPLVPGIILPPPPNFFAPLENKTSSERPNSSNKEPHSVKKPSKTRLPAINRPRNKLPSYFNSFKPKAIQNSQEQKVKATLLQAPHKNRNNVTQKPSYLNQTNEKWVPIPAPRPFYITDLKKLKMISGNQNDQYFKQDVPKNGWVYENNTKQEYQTEKIQIQNYVNNRGRDDPYKYLTTDISEINKVTPPQTTVANFHFQEISQHEEEKPLNENRSRNTKLTNIKLLKSSLIVPPSRRPKEYYYNKPYIESNTLVPQVIYEDVTVKNLPNNGRIIVPNIKYEDEYINTMKHTSKPLSFLYYEQEPKYQADDGGYVYDVPRGSAINPYQSSQFNILREQHTNKHKIAQYTTTQKPPVYEYSYSAPGYGTIEAPKVGNNFETTPKPTVYNSNTKSVTQPEYTYYDYQSTPRQNKFKIRENTGNVFYSTVPTSVNIKNKFVNINSYPTEKPFTSYNTQDIGLLDENTKTYFTLFGQKINQEEKDVTTSFPETNQNFYSKPYYQDYDSPTPPPTRKLNKNIRFPEIYNVQSDRPYYTKEEYAANNYGNSRKKAKSNPVTDDNYSYFYEPRNVRFQTYREYEPELVQPNHPLDSDVNVNYKNPKPDINPDAEYFDPTYINPVPYKENSYISYRLPGNSGHFYFLTPQTIQQGSYPERNTRDRYPEEQRRHFVRGQNF